MKILLTDDDNLGRKSVANFLRTYLNYTVVEAKSAQEGWKYFQEDDFPLVISDIKMPGMNGLEFLGKIKKSSKGRFTDVIIVTGFGELETAVEALRKGAFDYLQKPIDVEELAAVIDKSIEHQELIKENYSLKQEVKEQKNLKNLVSDKLEKLQNSYCEVKGLGLIGIFSPEMQEIKRLTEIFHNDREVSVLIQGETGTGKEVIARMVHYGSEDSDKPFITVNCSAITPTLFESELFGYESGSFTGAKKEGQPGKLELAQNGTLFLDEIGDMPLDMQPKLLRALQMKELYRVGGKEKIDLNVRIVCATNRNLEEMIEQGKFRRDLFFRLNTGHIVIPPLRERKGDIEALAKMFLLHTSQRKGKKFRLINNSALKILNNYSWQGNVRELQNSIERVVLFHDGIELLPSHLDFLATGQKQETPETNQIIIDLPKERFPYIELEKTLIKQVLDKFEGNKTKTAEYLNITRNRLNRKL